MTTNIGIVNVQNTPGDTDFDQDLPLNAEFVDQQLDTRQTTVSKKSGSQNDKVLINNTQTEAPRAMKAAAWTNYERRIF